MFVWHKNCMYTGSRYTYADSCYEMIRQGMHRFGLYLKDITGGVFVMKLAVTARGKTLESDIDPRFGRCEWFLMSDTETGEHYAVSNEQNLNAAQGAGIQAAMNVIRHDIAGVITGHCGPKAFRTLGSAGIKVYLCDAGTVAGALEKFNVGLLKESTSPDVQGHW